MYCIAVFSTTRYTSNHNRSSRLGFSSSSSTWRIKALKTVDCNQSAMDRLAAPDCLLSPKPTVWEAGLEIGTGLKTRPYPQTLIPQPSSGWAWVVHALRILLLQRSQRDIRLTSEKKATANLAWIVHSPIIQTLTSDPHSIECLLVSRLQHISINIEFHLFNHLFTPLQQKSTNSGTAMTWNFQNSANS